MRKFLAVFCVLISIGVVGYVATQKAAEFSVKSDCFVEQPSPECLARIRAIAHSKSTSNNLDDAKSWYEFAAQKGDPIAMFHLAWLYEKFAVETWHELVDRQKRIIKNDAVYMKYGETKRIAITGNGSLSIEGHVRPDSQFRTTRLGNNRLVVLQKSSVSVQPYRGEKADITITKPTVLVVRTKRNGDQIILPKAIHQPLHNMRIEIQTGWKQALKWYERSAEQKFAPAMNNIGQLIFFGPLGIPKPEEGMEWLLAAANSGNPVGQMNVAMAHMGGRGIEPDSDEVERWSLWTPGSGQDKDLSEPVLERTRRYGAFLVEEERSLLRTAAERGTAIKLPLFDPKAPPRPIVYE